MPKAREQMFGCDVAALVRDHVYGHRDPVARCMSMAMSILSDAQEAGAVGGYTDAVRQRINVAKYLIDIAHEGKVFGTMEDVSLADVIKG